MIGALFFAIAWSEWRVIERLEDRMDLVWTYAAIPVGIFLALLWQRIAGTYSSSDLFFWVSVVVTVGFGAAVTASRLRAERDLVAT